MYEISHALNWHNIIVKQPCSLRTLFARVWRAQSRPRYAILGILQFLRKSFHMVTLPGN